MIDTMKLAQLTQEFMAMLEAEHPEDDLLEVAIVAEVRNDANEIATPTACTNEDRIFQTGLFQWALDNVEWIGEAVDIPEPEE